MRPLRVVIADDHAPTRADIRAALEKSGRFTVCAEVADAVAAVDATVREQPDLCVLDIRMPGDGIAATWEISARLPQTKVVILTVSRDDDDLFAALRAGAVGYLVKDTPQVQLAQQLRTIADGDAAIAPPLLARLIAEFRDPGPRRRAIVADEFGAQLTSREWQVLDLLRLELTTAEIAQRLHLTQATVRSHVASILKKLRVPHRDAAVRLFRDT
jgi:DNA-binding NarL/FixJ family response regulator